MSRCSTLVADGKNAVIAYYAAVAQSKVPARLHALEIAAVAYYATSAKSKVLHGYRGAGVSKPAYRITSRNGEPIIRHLKSSSS